MGLGLMPVRCQPPEPLAKAVIQIRMDEYSFEPEEIRLKSGQEVELKLLNHGSVAHNFLVGRGVEAEDGISSGFATDFFSGVHVDYNTKNGRFKKDPGDTTEVELESLGEAILAFVVSPTLKGQWEIACFMAMRDETGGVKGTHYEAKMKGRLVVE